MLRAAGWTAAYVAAVLLPAAIALAADPITTARPLRVEAAAALGFFAFALILIEFALVSRLRLLSGAVGTDSLVQFHQWVGFGALALAAVHPWLLDAPRLQWLALSGPVGIRTGALALWAVALLIGSTVLRRTLHVSYERWRLLHMGLAVVAAGCLVVHVLMAGRYATAAPVRALIAAYACGFAAVVVSYRIIRPWRRRSRPWVVTSNRDEGASTRTLRVRPDGHRGFAFDAGQFAWLITGTSSFSSQQHPLSISSSAERPADGSIEFSIKALGDWSSTTIPALAAGTRVWVDGPFGAFTLPKGEAPLLLIAGGIGIAPCRSMLLTMRDRRDRRMVRLLYAANDPSRVLFTAELAELSRVLSIGVVYVFENPPADWQGHRGFITARVLREEFGEAVRDFECYVCGPPPMLASVERMLRSLRVAGDRIHTERFHVV